MQSLKFPCSDTFTEENIFLWLAPTHLCQSELCAPSVALFGHTQGRGAQSQAEWVELGDRSCLRHSSNQNQRWSDSQLAFSTVCLWDWRAGAGCCPDDFMRAVVVLCQEKLEVGVWPWPWWGGPSVFKATCYHSIMIIIEWVHTIQYLHDSKEHS